MGAAWSVRAGRDGDTSACRSTGRAARFSAADNARAPSVRRKSIWAWASDTPPTPTSTTAMIPSCRASSCPATDHRVRIERPPDQYDRYHRRGHNRDLDVTLPSPGVTQQATKG